VRLNSVIITFSGFKSGTCQRYSGRVTARKKARMQTHTGLFKTGDGVWLTQRPPLAQAGFAFRAAFTTAREAAVRFFLNPHGFAHTFKLLQHGVNHWLRGVQCLAYLGRFHTAP
jgi:integrase